MLWRDVGLISVEAVEPLQPEMRQRPESTARGISFRVLTPQKKVLVEIIM